MGVEPSGMQERQKVLWALAAMDMLEFEELNEETFNELKKMVGLCVFIVQDILDSHDVAMINLLHETVDKFMNNNVKSQE